MGVNVVDGWSRGTERPVAEWMNERVDVLTDLVICYTSYCPVMPCTHASSQSMMKSSWFIVDPSIVRFSLLLTRLDQAAPYMHTGFCLWKYVSVEEFFLGRSEEVSPEQISGIACLLPWSSTIKC